MASASGALIETRGYDAFGKPRTGTWANASPPRLGTTTNTPHGFTGHEHLNQLELIHMNGRVYDYNLGRFTGVDPVIQVPLNSQSLNPYSYILNNPLSGTDPTGYTACKDGTLLCTGGGYDMDIGMTITKIGIDLRPDGSRAPTGRVRTPQRSPTNGAKKGATTEPDSRDNPHKEGGNGLEKASSKADGSNTNEAISGTNQATMGGGQESTVAPGETAYTPEEWAALPHNDLKSMGRDLRKASMKFAKYLDAGRFRGEQAWVYLYDAYEGAVGSTLDDYFDYRYSTAVGTFTYPNGQKVAMIGGASLLPDGRVGAPIGFYRGAMDGSAIDDAMVFAHEMLHRNPIFADQFNSAMRAKNSNAIDQLHNDMDRVLDKYRAQLTSEGYH